MARNFPYAFNFYLLNFNKHGVLRQLISITLTVEQSVTQLLVMLYLDTILTMFD